MAPGYQISSIQRLSYAICMLVDALICHLSIAVKAICHGVIPHLTVNILHYWWCRVPVCMCTVQAVCAPVAMHALPHSMCVPQHPACLLLSPTAIECHTLLSSIMFIWQALEGPSTHNTAEVLSGRPETFWHGMLASLMLTLRVSIQCLQQ